MSGYTVTLTDSEYDALKARIRELEAAGNDLRASLMGMCLIANVMPDSCAARIKRFDDLFETPAETP